MAKRKNAVSGPIAKRRNAITDQFITLPVETVESPAFRVIRRIVDEWRSRKDRRK